MPHHYQPQDADAAWRHQLRTILAEGLVAAPRGQGTVEVLHTAHVRCPLAWPIVSTAERKLNYHFMAAEALWVLRGDNRVEPLAQHVERMWQFSDDGVHLAGAYGPPVVDQLPYVVDALLKDPDTRQATLTTWRPRPYPSKDVPCTVAMTFSARVGRLHQHVYMRSSDAWLGVPYDLFTFAMIGWRVLFEVNRRTTTLGNERTELRMPLSLGTLTVTPTSAHLYDRDRAAVDALLLTAPGPRLQLPVAGGAWSGVERALRQVEAEGRAALVTAS